MNVSGTTRVAAVIGQPVRHSLSPILHNAAFAAVDLDWVYLAFEVADGRAPAALDAMRTLRLSGLSVTMPHKAAVAAAVDRSSPVAARLGAVNCVRCDGDELVGENTDGEGFLRSLVDAAGFDPAGRRCVVVGAGGAARAVVLALTGAGASEVGIMNRRPGRARDAAELAGVAGRVIDHEASSEALSTADLVVNATPVGMDAGDGRRSEFASDEPGDLPFDPTLITSRQVIADLVYHPLRTALLQAADRRGATTVNGVGMLLHQAGLAFELWTGLVAPIDAMRAALLRHLENEV